jgi:predicted phage terminase large subunit-like protein
MVCLLKTQERELFRQRIRTAPDKELPILFEALQSYTVPKLEEWGRYFFPHYLTKPSSLMHEHMIAKLQGQHVKRGQKTAWVAPRAGAKTTWTTKIYTIYSIAHRLEPYELLVGATEKQAKKNLASIATELESNVRLGHYYPEACGRGPTWNTTELETRNGLKVEALGSGCSARGTSFGSFRPTLITVDDLMTDSDARSGIQRDHLSDWFSHALLPMGDRDTNVLFVGTALHREDTLQRLRTAGGWRFTTFKSLIREPFATDLWDQWRDIFCDPFNPERDLAALAFYQANKKAMDEGALVLWPENESLYDLMLFRNTGGLTTGEAAFQSEKQGNASAASKAEWPDAYFPEKIWFDRWPQTRLRSMAVDPSKGKTDTSDYSAIVSAGISDDGLVYIEADIQRREIPRIVEDGFDLAIEFRPHAFIVEINGFQELLQYDYNRVMTERAIMLPVGGVTNYRHKPTRIRGLGSYLREGRLRFKQNSPGTKILVDQLRSFPNGSHDDGPDALEMALQGLANLQGTEYENANGPRQPDRMVS